LAAAYSSKLGGVMSRALLEMPNLLATRTRVDTVPENSPRSTDWPMASRVFMAATLMYAPQKLSTSALSIALN
jgi:hypothetical protein